MRPLRQRLLHIVSGGVVVLTQFGCPGVDLDEPTASTLSLALNSCETHARCANFHAATEILLERLVADPFRFDGGSLSKYPVAHLAMRTLAFGSKPPFTLTAFGGKFAIPVGPNPLLFAFFDLAFPIEIVGVGCPSGAVHGALDDAELFPWLLDSWTEFFQDGVIGGHGSNGAWSDIQSDNAFLELAQLRRDAFLD